MDEWAVACEQLDARSADIVSTEHGLLADRHLVDALSPGGPGYADAQNRIRSRLGRIQRRFRREGVNEAAVTLEARLRHMEAATRFYDDIYQQAGASLTELGRRMFRLYHCTGPRTLQGRALPVPVVHSPALREALEFCGGLGDTRPQPGALILGDLLAVLDGGDATSEALLPSVRRAIGFCTAYPVWVGSRRIRDREYRRGQRSGEI